MTRFFAAIAMIALLCTSLTAQEAKAKPEVVKFTAKKPVAGDTVVKGTTNDTNTDMKISMGEMGEQTMSQNMKMKETKTVTVLKTNKEGKVTKFKIAYKEVKATQTQESPMAPEPMEMDMMEGNNPSGNTYIFTMTDEGVKVTDEKGEAVASDMAEFLKTAEAPEGKFVAWRPDASEMFSKREIAIGETVNIAQDKAMSIVPNKELLGDGVKITVKATLKEKKKVFGVDCAVFDTVTTIEGAPKIPGADQMGEMDMSMTMKLTGTMTIGVENMWLYSMKSEGPLGIEATIDMEEMSLTMSGEGKVKMSMFNAYKKTKLEAPKAAEKK